MSTILNATDVIVRYGTRAILDSATLAIDEGQRIGLVGRNGCGKTTFLKLLDAVWSGKVVGLSVSEFDPGRDVRDTGLELLGWLIEFVLLRVHAPAE